MAIPLATLGPTLDATGISAPSYADILATLQYQYRALYGQDADLDPDTQDGQFLGIQAAAINDSNNAIIAAYNARSPSSAQGAGLSSVVKINGLARDPSSNSTAPVTLTGQTGTTILNGIVGDNVGLGTRWALPAFTLIGDSGTVIVSATCLTPGAITAEIGTLTNILTPTRGWQSVTNADTASPGNPVEDDATLRQRQAVSQNQAAQSPVIATKAAILNLAGVTRCDYDENTSNTPDINGTPGNSVAFIVEGGDVQAIANTIALKKTIGCGTYGTTSEVVIDPAGKPVTINFFVLDLTTITVVVNLLALTGYADTTADLIKAAIADYISSLPIGAKVYLNKVEAIASLMGNPLNSTFEIPDGGVLLNGVSADVVIAFNKAAYSTIADITVNAGP